MTNGIPKVKRGGLMLKFRNGFYEKLCMAVIGSIVIVLLSVLGVVGSCIAGQSDSNSWGLKICGIIFGCVWLLFFLSAFVFTKKVVVTRDKIVVKRWGGELWSLDGNDIKECICYYNCALYFDIPNERIMKFILKSTDNYAMRKCKFGRYKCAIYLSVKKCKKMAEMGYNVNFTDLI